MNSTMKLFGFFLFALSLSFMACKGEDGLMGATGPAGTMGEMGVAGPVGPEGPAGPKGEDGRDGADGQDGQNGTNGTNGQDGEDGNANVFTSPWVTVDWDPNSTFGFMDITAPEITAEVIADAVILGFVRLGANSWIYGMPLTWISGDYTIQYAAREGIYEIYYSTPSAGTAPDFETRYVIIPPAGRRAADSSNPKQAILDELSAAGVDARDYDQVLKYLNIIQ